MPLPAFPGLRPLALADKPHLDAYLVGVPPYTEFNLFSLLAYYGAGCAIGVLRGNLVLRASHHLTGALFYTFLGTHSLAETARELLAHGASSHSPEVVLRYVPEECVRAVGSSPDAEDPPLRIEADRDTFDYVLSLQQLATLPGPAFGAHRNEVRKFARAHPDGRSELIDVARPDIAAEVLALFDRWDRQKERARVDVEAEREALARGLAVAAHFDLVSLATYVSGRMIAFSIAEVVGGDQAIAHFGKADAGFPGVNSHIEQESARHLLSRGCRLLNFQEDNGAPGLRRSKELWNPVSFLRKYTVRLAH